MKFDLHKNFSHRIKPLTLLSFVLISLAIHAQDIPDDGVNPNKIPPRIIRACCAFGYDLKLWGVPFVKIDQVIGIDELGEHHYMGNKNEGVGTVYTHKGGFIDIAHLRDQIDWTRYLYTIILNNRGKGKVAIPLRKEAGRKTLYLNVPKTLDDSDCVQLAGKIAYDFSLWHEISTWFGASTIPLLSEKFSSFTVEDVYSNLLGIHVGMTTVQSKLPFNEAATAAIAATLDSLAVVKTAKETYDAYDAVHTKWFSNRKRIPHTAITLKRDLDVLTSSHPWIVPDLENASGDPIVLEVPRSTFSGTLLTNYYEFTINSNYRIPVETLFPNRNSSIINQDDFGFLLIRIANDIQNMGYGTVLKNK